MRTVAPTFALLVLVLEGCARPAPAVPRPILLPTAKGAKSAGFAPGSTGPTFAPPRSGRGARGEGFAFEDETAVAGLTSGPDASLLAMGLTAFDMDGDGDLDLLMPTGVSLDAYRNDGDFHFTPMRDAGFPPDLQGYATAVGDCDGDGDLDVVVTSWLDMHLFRNEGNFTFTQMGAEAGFSPRDSEDGSLVFFDADGDGDLDLFLECYVGIESTEGFRGCQDSLFINDGACHFHDEAVDRGIIDRGFGIAVAAFDPDGDTVPDLAVVNDFGFVTERNRAWINDGTGHFQDKGEELGLGIAIYGMSASLGDLDGDGNLDLYESDICENVLLLGTADGHFAPAPADMGVLAGWVHNPDGQVDHALLDASTPDYQKYLDWEAAYASHRPPDDPAQDCLSSWSSPIVDLDADGHAELFVVNGMVGQWLESYKQPDTLYWAPGGMPPFLEVGAEAGLADVGTGRGSLVADLDGDGRLDILVGDVWATFDHEPVIHAYRNVTASSIMGHPLFIDLKGSGGNTSGIGASVEVWNAGRKQVGYRSFGTSTLGSSAAPMHFGLGGSEKADRVVVKWPWHGGVDTFRDVAAGAVTFVQGTGR